MFLKWFSKYRQAGWKHEAQPSFLTSLSVFRKSLQEHLLVSYIASQTNKYFGEKVEIKIYLYLEAIF